jgi:hypothetical protein
MTWPFRNNVQFGSPIAQVLAGAWRPQPPSLTLPIIELESLVPLLLETGVAGLAYRRLARAEILPDSSFQRLHEAYWLHTLGAAVQEKYLSDLLTALRGAGIESLLVKGWSIGRLYAEFGLRPCGDIDLCVRPQDLASTAALLTRAAGQYGCVDLHSGVADLDDRSWNALYSRSRLVPLPHSANDTNLLQVQVRILGAEDELRHLCLHFIRHGAWRPLWLCDVAAALESLPSNFDWDYCLSGNRCLTEWVISSIDLARRLLEARTEENNVSRLMARDQHRADWLAATVLHLWERGQLSSDGGIQPFRKCLYHLTELPEAMRQRWPNPIRAAFQLRMSPFHRLPLGLTQLAAFLFRARFFAAHCLELTDENVSSNAYNLHPAAKNVW